MMPEHRLPDGRIPVLLSAHEEDLIGHDAAAILAYLKALDLAEPTAAVAATLLRTRRPRRHRAVVRAADRTELEAGLSALHAGEQHPLVARWSETAARRVAFVFPGQGNHWPAMGADAYRLLPAYRAEADRCAVAFTAAGWPSPLNYLLGRAERDWPEIEIQGAQFTHAASLAQLWRSCGVLPDITMGHSLGEVAAAYDAGTIALRDAVAVVAARATVVGRLPGSYGMAVMGVGPAHAERMIAETPGWLELSVVNSPSSCVVSGERDAVAGIVRLAEGNGVFVRELGVEYPGHTSALEALRDTWDELLPPAAFLDAPVEFVSSARGGDVGAGTDFTDYWYDNLRHTVRFDRAVATAVQRGAGTFVEMSAHPVLAYALAELAEDALIVGSGRRDEPVADQLSAAIVTAALANPGYRWADLANTVDERPLWGFPTAPMREIHLWATPEPLPPPRGADLTVAHEEWEPLAPPQSGPAESVSTVAILGEANDALARRLVEAAGARDGCELTGPDEAEVAVVIAPALLDRDVLAAADQLGGATAHIDYHRAVGPRCRRVWLVTECGEQVNANPPVALPAQAALSAMHRSVGFEFPDATFAHLDLPTRDLDADTARGCVDALLSDQTEIALRFGGPSAPAWFVRRLRERVEPAPVSPAEPPALDDVVITGGSGTIGLRYARRCVERGAKRVILLSRSGVGRDDLRRVTDGYAAEVHAPRCDISDATALSVVADEYGGDGATLLIHAAGAATFAPHHQLGGAELSQVCAAKLTGLVRMTELWPRRPNARMLLCSSVSGVWGGYGHSAYAAANRMLDVLAARLRADGLDCRAVRWGLWRGTTIADDDEVARIERSGLIAMDPDAAVSAGLDAHGADPLILAADLDRLRVFFESQGAAMPFAAGRTDSDADSADDDDSRPTLSVSEIVRGALTATLNLDGPASLDLSEALVDLGVDSMLALDLRDRLRRETGQSISAASLLGGITGAELIESLQTTPRGGDEAATAKPDTLQRLESSRD